MHSVNIGIGSYYHLVVTQSFEAVLNVQGCLQKVELLVLIYYGTAQAKAVERLSAQAEHGLRIGIAALGY